MKRARGGSVVLVWPVWQRLLHWALAASVIAAIACHEMGTPHEVIGYAALALGLLRIVLGFAGPREARFSSFVRGVRATLAYARRCTSPAPSRPATPSARTWSRQWFTGASAGLRLQT